MFLFSRSRLFRSVVVVVVIFFMSAGTAAAWIGPEWFWQPILKVVAAGQATFANIFQNNSPVFNNFITNTSEIVETKGQEIFDSAAIDLSAVTKLALTSSDILAPNTGVVLSVDDLGNIVLVEDQIGISTTQTINTTNSVTNDVTNTIDLPSGETGATLYKASGGWLASTHLYFSGDILGLGSTSPQGRMHVMTGNQNRVGLIVQGDNNQTSDLTEWWNASGSTVAEISPTGKLTLFNSADDQAIEIIQTGNAGHLSSSGGALRIDNTGNIGAGIAIYSDAGAEALGNMINVRVNNSAYNQAAFFMDYDGISNAVEIVSNTNDSSSNALSVTGYNTQDSTVGIIGYETGKGTLKISHNGTGTDSNASGISIDLKGTGTRAQGIYVDSTATGGTGGNLLRLRNETIDRFVVNSLGSLTIGTTGTNTSITKNGNTAGDQFFVGTTGAFRVQRSATDSEAFRVQINGDIHGRWLGTSDGKLKWGDGDALQDVVLRRSAVGRLLLENGSLELESTASAGVNYDVLVFSAADGSRLGRFMETSGGAGLFEVDNASGVSQVLLRGDTGNVGIGTTSFGTGSPTNTISIKNGVAPTGSVTDSVQLYVADYDDADGSATAELFVRDEDGNATNLSPHNFSLVPGGASEDLAWSFYSQREGQAINVDMTKVVRYVEQLSGEQLVYIKDLDTGVELSKFEPTNLYKAASEEQVAKHANSLAALNVQLNEVHAEIESLRSAFSFESWLSGVIVQTKIVFEQSATFLSEVVIESSLNVRGKSKFDQEVILSGDQVGQAIIHPGSSNVFVVFSTPFSAEPVVTITPNSQISNYWVAQKTANGFSIELASPTTQEVKFDWHAFARTGQIFESESGDGVNGSHGNDETDLLSPLVEPSPTSLPSTSPSNEFRPSPTPVPSISPSPNATDSSQIQ